MKNITDFENIYLEYFEIVYKYLCCLTRNHDIAEELTQETFYKALMKIETFKNNSKISSWLCQIAKNLWYNELKRNKIIHIENDESYGNITSDYNIENEFIKTEEERELLKKINSLEEVTREVMYLRVYGNLSFKEIAEILRKK